MCIILEIGKWFAACCYIHASVYSFCISYVYVQTGVYFCYQCELSFDLWNQSCSSRWLAFLHGKTVMLGIVLKLFNHFFFHTYHVYRHHWPVPFYTNFVDVDHSWGSLDSRKQLLLSTFYCTLFSWTGWNFNLFFFMKQFKLNLMLLLLFIFFFFS